MAGSVNKVILVGNLGKDPEIRTFQNGGRVAHFSLATSESWKDKQSGERKDKTEWHRVSVYNEHIIGVVERFLKKGAKVYIEGQLETRKWTDKEGQEKYTTEVVIPRFRGDLTMLDSANSNRSGSNAGPSLGEDGGSTIGGGMTGGGSSGGSTADLDDSIPF